MSDLNSIRAQAETMMALFRGYTRKVCVADFANLHVEPNGKRVPDYRWLDRAPTIEDYIRHLEGKMGVLGVPIDERGETTWGAIDIDDYKLNLVALAKRIARANFPLVPARTKSGGAHLYLFLRSPIQAAPIRERLADYAAALGYAHIEIFPKQDRIDPGATPSAINLPYFGGDKAVNCGIAVNTQ